MPEAAKYGEAKAFGLIVAEQQGVTAAGPPGEAAHEVSKHARASTAVAKNHTAGRPPGWGRGVQSAAAGLQGSALGSSSSAGLGEHTSSAGRPSMD